MTHLLPEKPSSLGDLVSLAVRIFRLEWKSMTMRLLWPSALSSAAVSVMQVTISYMGESSSKDIGFLTGGGTIILLAFLGLIGSQWMLALRACGLLRQIFALDPDFKHAMQYAKRRQWAVLTMYTLGLIMPFVCGLIFGLLCLPLIFFDKSIPNLLFSGAILLGMSFFVAIAITSLLTSMLFAVVSLEDISFARIFARSFGLAFRLPFRGGFYMCLLWVVVTLITCAFSLILMPLEMYEIHMVGNNVAKLPFYVHLLRVIWSTFINIASMGIALVGAGLYYRDTMIRSEGSDLVERLNVLAKTSGG